MTYALRARGAAHAIVAHLLNAYRIFTVRITPAQFTMADQVDRFPHAVRDAARRFRA